LQDWLEGNLAESTRNSPLAWNVSTRPGSPIETRRTRGASGAETAAFGQAILDFYDASLKYEEERKRPRERVRER
jgi:hypothetical protein